MAMTLKDYQSQTCKTDVLDGSKNDIKLFLLGLFGEAGSVLSVLKKRVRDPVDDDEYQAAIVEELGDCLWYLSNICTRLDIQLDDLSNNILKRIAGKSIKSPNFTQIQSVVVTSNLIKEGSLNDGLFVLGSHAGKLLELDHQDAGIEDFTIGLEEILASIFSVAYFAELNMEVVAKKNLDKIFSRWPTPENKTFIPLFDADDHLDEQIPRVMKITFIERTFGTDRCYVIQRCNDINIGDRLTDNKIEQDDYRFHDVFHLSYATFLGWSPVLRALFKVKRKSKPKVDEVQDGARAILIEEGVSSWVFGRLVDKKGKIKPVTSIGYSLLKEINEFVKGYEVQACPLWQWEMAIIEGFKLFALLKEYRGGVITADLINRTLTYEKPI